MFSYRLTTCISYWIYTFLFSTYFIFIYTCMYTNYLYTHHCIYMKTDKKITIPYTLSIWIYICDSKNSEEIARKSHKFFWWLKVFARFFSLSLSLLVFSFYSFTATALNRRKVEWKSLAEFTFVKFLSNYRAYNMSICECVCVDLWQTRGQNLHTDSAYNIQPFVFFFLPVCAHARILLYFQ